MLFKQQQCFIYSTARFFVEIESKEGRKTVYSRHKTASTNDGLPEISKKKYRNRIPELGTTISGFADSQKNFFFNADLTVT
jgi:deoxyribodipyrimidine photolyase-like uncharacterized protein